jgi:hypothetical protein
VAAITLEDQELAVLPNSGFSFFLNRLERSVDVVDLLLEYFLATF